MNTSHSFEEYYSIITVDIYDWTCAYSDSDIHQEPRAEVNISKNLSVSEYDVSSLCENVMNI